MGDINQTTKRKEITTSYLTFLAICGEFYIDPDLAMENPMVVDAIKRNDANEVRRILHEEC